MSSRQKPDVESLGKGKRRGRKQRERSKKQAEASAQKQVTEETKVASGSRRKVRNWKRLPVQWTSPDPGPISKLPVELLSSIFECMGDCDISPWLAATVCKLWRTTSLVTPTLWRYITLSNDDEDPEPCQIWLVYGLKWQTSGREQVCRTSLQLADAIGRAGSLPLLIRAVAHIPPTMQFLGLIDETLRDPIASKLLSLAVRSLHPFEAVDESASSDTVITFANLRHLHFLNNVETSRRIAPLILQASPSLEDITADEWLVEHFVDWGRIRSFSLADGFSPSSEHWDTLVKELKNVKQFKSSPYSWPKEATLLLRWPNLRSLSVSCDPAHLSSLDLPSLEYLRLSDARHHPLPIKQKPPRIMFGQLTDLEIMTVDLLWFAMFDLPRLRKLKIMSTARFDAISRRLDFASISTDLPELRSLTLSTDWEISSIAALLRVYPGIHNLTIEPLRSRSVTLHKALLRHLGKPSLPCPQLAALTLGHFRAPLTLTFLAGSTEADRILSSHRAAGKALMLLIIYWKDGRRVYSD